MKKCNFQKMIKYIIQQKAVDYELPKSVRKYNRTSDKIHKEFSKINFEDNEEIIEFKALLNHEEAVVRIFAAEWLIIKVKMNRDELNYCVGILVDSIDEMPDENKFVERLWLHQWQEGNITFAMNKWETGDEGAPS
ncbi:MAG: hypothetical protein IKB27_05425 [Clostridia bacterium]|nr:hypothetical protein [Clostridia bacterium]